MAEIKEPQRVLPVVGLIFIKGFDVHEVLEQLRKEIGNVISESNPIPFTHTTYYNREMGENLQRQWCLFDNLITPDTLIQLKHICNNIEKKYLNKKDGRKINIDPGLITLSNLILASTKDFAHRIYLGKGIYGEVTLIYKDKMFHALDWTYPDYQEKIATDFFIKAREILKEKLPIILGI